MAAKPAYSNLCAELHDRTKAEHEESDKLVNVKLLVALTDRVVYGKVLKDFYFVYAAIEDALEAARDCDLIFPLRSPVWYRAAALDADAAFFLGGDWMARHQPTDPVKTYLQRIETVRSEDPALLVAYANTMFLAALAGGPVLGAIVRRTLGLKGEDGLAFFHFGDEEVKDVKTRLKAAINALNVDPATKERLVEEKKRIFRMNNAIVSQVPVTVQSVRGMLKLIALVAIVVVLLLYLLFRLLR